MAQPGSGAAETSGNAFSIASLTSLPRRMHPLPRKVMRSPKHSSVIHPTSGAGAGGSPLPPVMKKTGSMSQLMRYRSLNSGDSDSDTEDSSSTVDGSDLIAAEALSREISSDEATAATAAAATATATATAIPTTSSDTSNSIPTIVTSSTSSSSNPTISVSASCPPQGALLSSSSSSSSGSPARLRSLPAGRRVLALDAISLSQRQLPRVSFSFGEYVPGDDLLTGELLMPLSSRDSNTTDDVVIDIMMAPDGPAASSSAAATASGSSETAATSAAAAASSPSSSKQTPEQIAYRNRQRRRTIAELIQTEADYIKDLQILIQQIMLPMGRKRDFLTDTPLVSPEQMQTIFSNITTLPAVNIELLDRFEQACESTDLVAELANWLPSTAARQAFMSPITSPVTSPRGSPTRVRSPRTSPRTSPSHAAQLSASLEVLAAKENCADRSPSSDSSPSKSASSSSDNTASSSIADATTLIVAADASPAAAAAAAATSATDGTLEGLIAFDHQSPIMIGKIFLDLADYFKMYTQYCANQPKCMRLVEELCANTQFEAFLCERRDVVEECRNLDLKAFVIKPVQRLCKYPLFLREIIRYTDPKHPDYQNLVNAFDQFNEVVIDINTKKRRVEHQAKLAALSTVLSFPSGQAFPILVPSRQYHEEGIFKKIALRKKVFKGAIFVMSDIIIISKAKKASKKDTAKWEYRARLSTATCIVKALASDQFVLSDDVHMVTVTAPSAEERDKWVQGLTQLRTQGTGQQQ